MNERRSDLREGQEHERALVCPRMGHLEPRQRDAPLAIEEQVEVDRSRTPAYGVWSAIPAERGLDPLQPAQQLDRGEPGPHRHHRVQIRSLTRGPERRRLEDPRSRQ